MFTGCSIIRGSSKCRYFHGYCRGSQILVFLPAETAHCRMSLDISVPPGQILYAVKQLFSYTLCRPCVDILRGCLELFANLPTPQHWSLKLSDVDCVSAAQNWGGKNGTIGPFPGTFTGSVELSYTPTITILCRSLFLNLLAIYLAISPSPVILF